MGVLEKITANMELIELKKFKFQKAILALMREWKHLEEYMDSTQHSLQECLDELQLKEKYLNSVQESAVESNKEMESIRVSIEGRIQELDDKEREFQVFRDEQVNELDLKEKRLGLIVKSIEKRIKLVEFREEKLAVEEKQFEDIRKSAGERIEEINSKGMLLEKRLKELDAKEEDIEKRFKELESKEKELGV